MKIFAISDLHMSVANPKPMDIFVSKWANYLDKINALFFSFLLSMTFFTFLK